MSRASRRNGDPIAGIGENALDDRPIRRIETAPRRRGDIPRLTQFYPHQTLRLGLFAFWGISDDDGYLIPSVRYAFSDAIWGEGGANLFIGNRTG